MVDCQDSSSSNSYQLPVPKNDISIKVEIQ